MVPGSIMGKIFAAFVWFFWVMIAFGTGSRGELLYAVLPLIALVFIKYVVMGNDYLGRISSRAVLYSGMALFVTLIAVKIQGTFRNSGLQTANLQSMDIFESDGNAMFSAGLSGLSMLSRPLPPPQRHLPGAALSGPFPTSPSDLPSAGFPAPSGITNRASMIPANGTTACSAAARPQTSTNPIPTHAEEPSPPQSPESPLSTMALPVSSKWAFYSAGCAPCAKGTCAPAPLVPSPLCFSRHWRWLFRAYRDLTPHNLYPLLIGTIVISVLVYLLSPFTGQPSTGHAIQPYQS